jgi:hypothetical protein
MSIRLISNSISSGLLYTGVAVIRINLVLEEYFKTLKRHYAV